MKATGPGLQVLQTHGRRDPILPFAAAEGLQGLLSGAGAQVEWVAHDGGHEIPMRALQRLQAFARDRLHL
jgi:phospholipase/carboxylesterase